MAPPSNPPSQLPPEVLAALRSGNVVEAIKLLRKSHPRMGLSEAKALLDAMQKLAVKPQHASAPKPPQGAAPKHPHASAHKPSEASDPSAPFIAQPGLSPGEVPRSSNAAGAVVLVVIALLAALLYVMFGYTGK